MSHMPQDNRLDSTLAFVRDPYGFILKQCGKHHTNMLRTRLLFQDTVLMVGSEAAELFYDSNRFVRKNAMPGRVQKTLTGETGVQGLDDEAHKHRKQLFMSLVTPEKVENLTEITVRQWHTYAGRWETMEHVNLYDEMRESLCRAVCEWAGVPLDEAEVHQRTNELTALFAYAGAVGLRHWWARLARKRAENWAESIIERIRTGQISPPAESAAHLIAFHRDASGNPLSARTAAVELLNVLRPTVAVSVFIVFVAHALHTYPESRQKLETGDNGDIERFVQEVRRYYPFFPTVVARVRKDFEHNGYCFDKGTRVLLDLHGTNHHQGTWETPEVFRPDRFLTLEDNGFKLIPQGGGDPNITHRCPGEPVAVALMKAATRFLMQEIDYTAPPQNLQINRASIPALPHSRFILSNVRR